MKADSKTENRGPVVEYSEGTPEHDLPKVRFVSRSFSRADVEALAAATLARFNAGEKLERVMYELAPNVEADGVFTCAYDLRKAAFDLMWTNKQREIFRANAKATADKTAAAMAREMSDSK